MVIFDALDDETGKPNGDRLSVRRARGFVKIQLDDPGSAEWGGVVSLDAERAIEAGKALVRLGQEQILVAAGWLPVEHPNSKAAREEHPSTWKAGDWTPPEDRGNFWDFDRAVAEMRKRAVVLPGAT